ncbi:PD-(D/E)XK nuclease family protein [Paenalcaligenes niemegkensis]|uniref:PD-(D/E)XK nuclease family protein n=1 Tax=Paenalcaligenes niemegkensis TaxID=2895469 RepID=UPI001EE8453B|nr:PD-(D/E)XK nuclease family protein [Paenalcaligenes niemegkensis]MCQ9615823.1 PD-(D/E)XK nuclease family protein [Paenalcaligenes niemegkensis]
MQDFPLVELDEIESFDSTRTLILTVNNRYARRILSSLHEQLSKERRTVAVPDIIPMGAWLRGIADELCFSEEFQPASHLLDSFGTIQLWEQAIHEVESEERVLLDVRQAAMLACEADNLLDEWEIQVVAGEESPDYLQFLHWRENYHEKLIHFDLDDANRSNQRVRLACEAGVYKPQFTTLVLAGFHETSPRFTAILHALQSVGVDVLRLSPMLSVPRKMDVMAADDADHEWRLAARWAVTQLRQNPNSRVAIIAAQLEANVPYVHRVMAKACAATENESALSWNVAVGRSLSEWHLVRAALAWLKALALMNRHKSVEPEILGSALLAGSCAGSLSEENARAVIDVAWRRNAELSVKQDDFQLLLQAQAPLLAGGWRSALEYVQALPGRQSPTAWAQSLRQVLQLMGFPGQESLDSHAYQVMEAFDARLAQFARQTPVLRSISFLQAHGLLTRLLRETLFQPQRDPRSRLDVLGFLEAEGGHWDAVWMLGLSDEVLPAAVKPNPLLPHSALRRANAPRATPERELQWAGQLFQALSSSAPVIRLSYPQYQGEQLLRASPLLREYQCAEPSPDLATVLPSDIEFIDDSMGPPVAANEIIRGGVGVLDTQARSPLWAFVKYRLAASDLPEYASMSDLNARGLFLHRAMELLWKECPSKNSEGLRTWLDEAGVEQVLSDLIEQAAEVELVEYSGRLRELECERAVSVLKNWLSFEFEREPFSVIELESELQFTYQHLSLGMRLDRLDQLSDGRYVVFDYKTSLNRSEPLGDWIRHRPINLQLPLYAAHLLGQGQQVAAIALAWLNARSPGVTGYSDTNVLLGDTKNRDIEKRHVLPTWDEQLQQWNSDIQALADEFSQGLASNRIWDPNDLLYCDVLAFLRLNEEQL